MELKALIDYMNNDFTILKGNTTIGVEFISDEAKEYLITTFPEWFEETSIEKEKADEAERLRIEAILKANEEERLGNYNPFDADAVKLEDFAKTVEDISTPEDGLAIENNDSKTKTKKK